MWLTAEEALARLGSKPQSLYANVSRGRIRAKPDPTDKRRSLYQSEDVDRLAARARGRRSAQAVASGTMSWGEPVLPSAISTVSGGRLYYRGRDAAVLADTATLEDIVTLLWVGEWELSRHTPVETPSFEAALAALAEMTAHARPSAGPGVRALRAEAGRVLGCVAAALIGGEGQLHQRLARHFQRPEAADDLRRTLILLADHELNASTFAVRITVSTGASLAAGALSGFAALSGPRHGSAPLEIMGLADDVRGSEAALRDWLGEGRVIPGFGHRLYPGGDIRARALLAQLDLTPPYRALARAGEKLGGEPPNVDFALAALTATYGLPRTGPMTIFALARTVGWVAHMLEQAETGHLIRPRAIYVGTPPGQTP